MRSSIKTTLLRLALLALSLTAPAAALAAQATYYGTGRASFTGRAPAGFSGSGAGLLAGPVTLDYTAGVLSMVGSGLVTTTGQTSFGQGLGNPPLVTNVAGAPVALTGSIHPFGAVQGETLVLQSSWFGSLFSQQDPFGPIWFQGFSITGTPTDLASGAATMSINFRSNMLFPQVEGVGHLDLVPFPEPGTLGLLALGALGLRRRR